MVPEKPPFEKFGVEEGDPSPDNVRRIYRKVDFRLIPLLSAMYCVALVDRTNLSLARAANNSAMYKELGFKDNNRYTILTLIFFVPYIVFEIPSQIGLRKFGARLWLGSAVFLWGIVMLCFGFAPNWQTLAFLRAMLGMFESALFPGAAYLIACWYTRKQMATRNTLFYVLSSAAGGLAATLAYGISTMHGLHGKSGWRWIFIIEGVITIAIGILGILFIVDFPDKATFLNPTDRNTINEVIHRDRRDAVFDPLTWSKLGLYARDWRPWVFAFFFGTTTLGTYSLAYFLPQILYTMGFTNIQAQLLVAPPYVYMAIPAMASALISDKVPNMRGNAFIFNVACVLVGTCMYSQLDLKHKAARYAGIFISLGGCNSNVPLVLAWAQTAIRQQSKRGFMSALIVGSGGLGGILAGVTFIEKEAKTGYPTGIWFTMAMNALALVLAVVLTIYMRMQNRRADEGRILIEGDEDFRYQP